MSCLAENHETGVSSFEMCVNASCFSSGNIEGWMGEPADAYLEMVGRFRRRSVHAVSYL